MTSCANLKEFDSNAHDVDCLVSNGCCTKETIDVDSSDCNEDGQLNCDISSNATKDRVKCKRTYRDISKLDENVREVDLRLKKGCECQEQNCFDGFDSEAVYKHRLNIDELSKLEHDMYLMGITMACMESPDETNRHKERKRLRAKYRFKVSCSTSTYTIFISIRRIQYDSAITDYIIKTVFVMKAMIGSSKET